MSKEFIVAIELGSSMIRGIDGHKNLDGSITVLAYATEKSNQCIRKGAVYNVDKTVQAINSVVTRIESALTMRIERVYVGIGGQSVHSVKNSKEKTFPLETRISDEIVDSLRDDNAATIYPEMQLLYPVAQEFKVDSQRQVDPVGIQCHRIEGNFLNILCRKNNYRNLNNCFERAGLQIAEMYLSPVALADSVLSGTEKRTGCALIDFGAQTTTVAVYYKSILRHLSVVPLGGENITQDLESYPMERDEAENLKIKYGSAYTENENVDPTKKYDINPTRKIDSVKFLEIVEARSTEIIANAINQIPSEYADKLISGIVITGGGANMRNVQLAIEKLNYNYKIRQATFVKQAIKSNKAEVNNHNGTLNTLLGLLAKGDMNCAGSPISNTIFGQELNPSERAGVRPEEEMKDGNGKISNPKEDQPEPARGNNGAENERDERDGQGTTKTPGSNRGGKIRNGLKKFWKHLMEEEENQ